MSENPLSLAEFQNFIEQRYGAKDTERGVAKTFLWLIEEVGELARALGREDQEEDLAGEFADILGWLTTLANMKGIDLEAAVRARYLSDGGRDHKG